MDPVNITPELLSCMIVCSSKRQQYLVNEHQLIERFKAGLDELWKPSRGTFQVQQPLQQSMLNFAAAAGRDKQRCPLPSLEKGMCGSFLSF